jgi:hypothetical protein
MDRGCPCSQEGPRFRVSHRLAATWMTQFFVILNEDRSATDELRDSSLQAELGRWTNALTAVVVRTFQSLGMPTTAKGHVCTVLPMKLQEYLGQDVMAFPTASSGWHFPTAVCELENAVADERVAYSLWKVLCIRCRLRLVFCYRPEARAGAPLVKWLGTSVIDMIPVAERATLQGETIIVVGSRNAADTFPYGFFQAWKLNTNTGLFERLPRE